MSRSRSRRKPSEKSRRQQAAEPRETRVMQEIKNRRYLAFVRAIVNGVAARPAR